MSIAMNFTKLVVGDVAAAERFYRAIGLQVVSRNLGGEAEVRQEQCWLSATGEASRYPTPCAMPDRLATTCALGARRTMIVRAMANSAP